MPEPVTPSTITSTTSDFSELNLTNRTDHKKQNNNGILSLSRVTLFSSGFQYCERDLFLKSSIISDKKSAVSSFLKCTLSSLNLVSHLTFLLTDALFTGILSGLLGLVVAVGCIALIIFFMLR